MLEEAAIRGRLQARSGFSREATRKENGVPGAMVAWNAVGAAIELVAVVSRQNFYAGELKTVGFSSVIKRRLTFDDCLDAVNTC